MTQPDYPGVYHDGRTAAGTAILLRPGAEAITICRPDGTRLFAWGYDRLALASVPAADRPVLLRHRDREGERLEIADGAVMAELTLRAPDLLRGSGFGRDNRRILGWCAGAMLTIAIGIWALAQAAEPIATRLPLGWERPLGLSVLRDLTNDARICDRGAGQAALDALVARLAQSGRLPDGVAVTVRDDARVNAVAAPGGQIAILRGLIDQATSAEEIAGVLAHEIGHVIHRHPTQGMVRMLGSGIFLQLLTGTSGLPAGLLSLRFSRAAESQADDEAAALLAASRISPAGLAAFFARALEKHPAEGTAPSFLSDHPGNAERLGRLQAAPARPSQPALTAEQWRALQAICSQD